MGRTGIKRSAALPGSLLLLAGAAFVSAVAFSIGIGTQEARAQSQADVIKTFRQARWTFDIQDGRIRFSHGNHQRRDRWFRAYFGRGYSDCTTCHRISRPAATNAAAVDFAAEIRKHADAPAPYGIEEATCRTCHNNVTAPADCAWCHTPGSEPLESVQPPALGPDEEPVDRIVADYDEQFERGVDTVREYKEKRWAFDIQNDNIRFSHGNHKSRDRFFHAYFGTGYDDCGNCHNLGLLTAGPQGPVVENGEHLNTVEDIREYESDIVPFGIMMGRCFSACHNGLTAPNDCTNCHLPGSRPLSGEAISAEVAAVVESARQVARRGDVDHPGAKVYAQRQCNLCHAMGEAGAPIASVLSDIGTRRDMTWLAQFLTNNHQEPEASATTPAVNLSEMEAQSLAQYLVTLR